MRPLRLAGCAGVALWDVLPLAVSDLTIAGISAGAALLGALVGGLVTYLVEKQRQQHEWNLESERYENERVAEDVRYQQGTRCVYPLLRLSERERAGSP